MNEIGPLALLLCQRGLVATQVAQRLEGLGYRFLAIAKPGDLAACAERERAMVILADIDSDSGQVGSALDQLKAKESTAHIPVICFAREVGDATQSAFMERGIIMVVTEAAVLSHLCQLLERALEIH